MKCSAMLCAPIACSASRSLGRSAAIGAPALTFSRSAPSGSSAPASDARTALPISSCQGIERVEFVGFVQEAPYPIARIKPLKTRSKLNVETDALAAKVLEFYAQLKETGRKLPEKVDRYLSEMSDPEMLADLIASTFISDAERRQQLLESALHERLRLLIQYLREEGGSAAA